MPYSRYSTDNLFTFFSLGNFPKRVTRPFENPIFPPNASAANSCCLSKNLKHAVSTYATPARKKSIIPYILSNMKFTIFHQPTPSSKFPSAAANPMNAAITAANLPAIQNTTFMTNLIPPNITVPCKDISRQTVSP